MKSDPPGKTIANVWYFAASLSDKAMMNKVLSSLANQQIASEKWTASCKLKIGIIFFGGLHDYEEVISFLQLQIKESGSRVCVVNLNTDLFETDYKIRILRYGAEYFFERSYLTEPFDGLVERMNRWITID